MNIIDTGQSRSTENSDLRWTLENLANSNSAVEFLRSVKDGFCVHSGTVSQLYGSYDCYETTDRLFSHAAVLVILPTPEDHTFTFNRIPPELVKPTGCNIFSGKFLGKEGLVASLRLKNGKTKIIPASSALNLFYRHNRLFCPVVTRGDLREFPQKAIPYLHLHQVRVKQLAVSELTRSSLVEMTMTKFSRICKATDI